MKWVVGFVLWGKREDPMFSLFCGVLAVKTCPSPSFLFVVVAWAGVPDCASFAAWERCTYGTVRVSEGVSGKRRDRQFSVVKGVVCHSRCAMFCAPPHLLFRKKTILFTGWCVFAEGELLTVMVRLSEFWILCWWCTWEGNAVEKSAFGHRLDSGVGVCVCFVLVQSVARLYTKHCSTFLQSC